jgi:hypothetical protein
MTFENVAERSPDDARSKASDIHTQFGNAFNAAVFKTVDEVREASDAMLLSLRHLPLINFENGAFPMR